MAVESSEPTLEDRSSDESPAGLTVKSDESRDGTRTPLDRSIRLLITSPSSVRANPITADWRMRNSTLGCKNMPATSPSTASPSQIVRNRARLKMARKPRNSVAPEHTATSEDRATTQITSATGSPDRLKTKTERCDSSKRDSSTSSIAEREGVKAAPTSHPLRLAPLRAGPCFET